MRDWVKGQDELIRELIPGPLLSDEARTFYIDAMTAIAADIGPQAFQAVVGRIVATCERRPTIATFRKLAGLGMDAPTPAAAAWDLVSMIVVRHLDRDGNGMAFVAPKTRMVDGQAVTEQPPVIPEPVRRAVIALGGWTALAESYPSFWGMRWQHFKDLYHESAPSTALTK